MRKTFLLVALLLSTSCSYFKKESLSPAAKATVVNVCVDFLNYAIAGSGSRLNNVVLWTDYFGVNKKGFSKEEFQSQLQYAASHWSRPESPLRNLDLLSLESDGEFAEVEFRRIDDSDAPVIWLKLLWNGSGWKVVDDSIFGLESEDLYQQVATQS